MRNEGRWTKRRAKRESVGGGRERLKGVFAKNERGYRLNAIKKRF